VRSLPEIAQPVVDEYRPMAATLGIELTSAFPADLPSVIVDEEVIGRVFSNLLDNALKYTPAGGQILVRATPGPAGKEGWVQCAIVDTGTGIAEGIRKVIFDKFRRGEQAPHGRRQGMGIGLHYCKVAVEAHGGRIWVESEVGQGSAFCFTLPVAKKTAWM
jgi:signal transduction histidine kinase